MKTQIGLFSALACLSMFASESESYSPEKVISTAPTADKKAPEEKSPYRFSVEGAFTYWYAKEDGLGLAESASVDNQGITHLPSQGVLFQQSFGYNPGFIVGLGFEYIDCFALDASYTYYRSTETKNQAAPTPIDGSTGVWSVENWYLQTVASKPYQNLSGTYLSSKWKLAMDLGDLILRRPYIEKKRMECSPFAGLRTVWFRQTMNIYLTQMGATVGHESIFSSQPLESSNSSHAWGLGPIFGLDGRCKLGMGFHLGGHVAGALLYEKFTSVKHSELQAASIITLPSFSVSMDYNCVRPAMEAGMGFGWDRTFYDKYQFSLSASYDFSYYWGQNMMRTLLDQVNSGVASGDNDLYFQGLTITAGFAY